MVVFLLCFFGLMIINFSVSESKSYFLTKEYTQNWKGFLCIFILVSHFLEIYQWDGVVYNMHSFAYIVVAIFFMFSGYGLKYSLNKNPDYLDHFFRKRLLKLYIPYFVSIVLIRIIWMIKNSRFDFSIVDFLKSCVGYDAIWFIKVIFIFYFIFWFVYKYCSKHQTLVMLAATIIYMLIVCFVFKTHRQWYGSVLAFDLGIILADNPKKTVSILKKRSSVVIAAVAFIVFSFAYRYTKEYVFLGWFVCRNILCLSAMLVFLVFTYRVKIGNKFLSFMGKFSYEFFLIHLTVIYLIKGINIPLDIKIFVTYFVSLVLGMVIHYVSKPIIKKFT